MPDISSIGHGTVGPVDHPSPASFRRDEGIGAVSRDAPPTRPGDRVELSDHARYLDRLRQLPDRRGEELDAIRRAISEGSYETDDKLVVAIDELIEDLLTE